MKKANVIYVIFIVLAVAILSCVGVVIIQNKIESDANAVTISFDFNTPTIVSEYGGDPKRKLV